MRSTVCHPDRVAGGMNAPRGLPMSSRVRLGREEDPCPARHCWVAGAADDQGVKRPGLLVEWRARAGDWEGLVVYVAQLRPGVWAVVEEWLPASLLTPR
jgi:hypothetical protein